MSTGPTGGHGIEQNEPVDLRLRLAGAADLGALEGMVRAYYAEDGHVFDPVRQPAALQAIVAGNPWVRGWMVTCGGVVIGYAVVTISFSVESGGRDGFLDEVYLVPAMRNRGLGRRLLELIDDEARALGLNRLYLEVEHHNPAIRLYRRAGYRDHRRYLMSKDLGRPAPEGREASASLAGRQPQGEAAEDCAHQPALQAEKGGARAHQVAEPGAELGEDEQEGEGQDDEQRGEQQHLQRDRSA